MKTKVVIMGPVCAGKTSFVHALSEQTSLSTEAPATSPIGKEQTTVGLDVGQADIAGHQVRAFGTPGQERFEYMWDLLLSGADGVVLLIPADRTNAVATTERMIENLSSPLRLPVGVGITRCDCTETPVLPEVEQTFEDQASFIQRLDARATDECRHLLVSLVHEIEAQRT